MNTVKTRIFATLSICTCLALLVPSLLFPGSWIVLLPVLAIAQLFIGTTYELSKSSNRCTKRILTFTAATVVASTCFALLFDVAWGSYKNVEYVSKQFSRIKNLRNPELIRDLAVDLHYRLMAFDPDNQRISGDSDLVPQEIRDLQPVSIFASEHYLIMKMTQTGDSLAVIYPPGSTKRRVSAFKVTDDFYYWGRQH